MGINPPAGSPMQRSCKAPLPNLIITSATPLRAARETPMLSGRPWLFALKRSTWAKEGDLMCYLQTYTLLKGPHLTRYGAYQREATLWQMKLLFHGNSPATRTANSMTGLLGSWEWRTATELPTPNRAVLCQPPPAVSSKRVCCLHWGTIVSVGRGTSRRLKQQTRRLQVQPVPPFHDEYQQDCSVPLNCSPNLMQGKGGLGQACEELDLLRCLCAKRRSERIPEPMASQVPGTLPR